MDHSGVVCRELEPGDIKPQQGKCSALPGTIPLPVFMGASERGSQTQASVLHPPPRAVQLFQTPMPVFQNKKTSWEASEGMECSWLFYKVLLAPGGGCSRAYPSPPYTHLTAIIDL